MVPTQPQRLSAPASRRALLVRASALKGHTVAELAQAVGAALPACSLRGKGFVGQLVEHALGADPDAKERPDFPQLGIELKTVPVDALGRPMASTFVCSIAMAEADRAEWAESILRRRLGCVLFVPVFAGVQSVAYRRFGAAWLWTPTSPIQAGLRADWEHLMGAIGQGRGHSLSAREGVWLQVRPKAAHARVRTVGPGEDGMQALLPLGFYLRARFTRLIFAHSQKSAR